MIVVDQPVSDKLFSDIRRYAHSQHYSDVQGPIDGVTYPGICPNVPRWMERLFQHKIADYMDRLVGDIDLHMMFFRLTTESTPPAPHGAHNDVSHGKYSMFFYVNDKPANHQGLCGTSLLSHKKLGMEYGPKSPEEFVVWEADTNDYDAWHIDSMAFWEPNRMVIYDSSRMHRAEPVGGFGTDPTDGRLVLIAFFSC